ncbi:MAG: glycosyltransferase [Candidatus Sulfotelmatobacter sp.]
MQEEVSVILPVYNAKEFLAQALRSVLDQTHQRFELIAVDDGSTDGSGEILADFARQDKRIVFWRTENQGPAATANACLARAKNDLVVRLDADDLMVPDRIERQIWFMQRHPDISVATSYVWLIDRNGKLIAEAKPKIDIDRGIREYRPHCFVDIIQPATIMRKRHIQEVGGYSREYRFAEDRELWGRLVASGYRLDVQPEFLVKQRIHRSSLTAKGIRGNIVICKFIDQNTVRLLQGQKAISLQTFHDSRRNTPVLKRLARDANELSKVYYKEATRDFAEKNWGRFFTHSTSAICLNPIWALRMLKRMARWNESRERVH